MNSQTVNWKSFWDQQWSKGTTQHACKYLTRLTMRKLCNSKKKSKSAIRLKKPVRNLCNGMTRIFFWSKNLELRRNTKHLTITIKNEFHRQGSESLPIRSITKWNMLDLLVLDLTDLQSLKVHVKTSHKALINLRQSARCVNLMNLRVSSQLKRLKSSKCTQVRVS